MILRRKNGCGAFHSLLCIIVGFCALCVWPAAAGVIEEAEVYYAFEGSGQIVEDRSGGTDIDLQMGSTSGSDANDPTRTTGKVGSGLSFDGDDVAHSVVDVDRLDFNADDAFSVAGWFRRATAAGTIQKFLMSKMTPSGAYPGWFMAWRDDGISTNPNSLLFYMRDNEGSSGNGALQIYTNPVTNTDWVHVAVTYDGSSNPSGVQFYLDGQPLGVDRTGDDLEPTDVTDNGTPFNLGGRADTGSWDGLQDEIGVWNRVLTESEVQETMTGIPEPGSGLLLVIAGMGLLWRRRGRS